MPHFPANAWWEQRGNDTHPSQNRSWKITHKQEALKIDMGSQDRYGLILEQYLLYKILSSDKGTICWIFLFKTNLLLIQGTSCWDDL